MKIKVITSSVLFIMVLSGFIWMTACSTSKSTEKSAVNTASAATASTTAPVPSSAPAVITPPPASEFVDSVGWEKMDRAERLAHMKQVVLPQMREAFRAFNPKKYDNMKCVTCHGAGAKDDTYKMPNPQLPKLPRSKEGWDKIMAHEADMMKFMKEIVKPKMAELLGMKPFDMKTMTGFGCGNCHTDEKE